LTTSFFLIIIILNTCNKQIMELCGLLFLKKPGLKLRVITDKPVVDS
jgi:hypothetical protein